MTYTQSLSSLLHGFIDTPVEYERTISHLTSDSREVRSGSLFFAYPGTHLDGRAFIDEAIAKQAVAIVMEAETAETIGWQNRGGIPIISLSAVAHSVSELAARFYGYPASRLKVIGITGTNGKTSCSHFIAASCHQVGIKTAVIGTIGTGIYGEALTPSTLTTPDPIHLQALFADFVQQNVSVVAMEVSSYGLTQGRVEAVPFFVTVFTNLSRDHLDLHGTMEAYGQAKKRLFELPEVTYAVINADDEFGRTLLQTLPSSLSCFAYSLDHQKTPMVPRIFVESIQTDSQGLHATLHSPWGEGEVRTRLMGRFNLSNILAVFTVLRLLDIPFNEVLSCLSSLSSVPGRMEALGSVGQPLVVIDYSHTPDALEKALVALREHCSGKLHCLFGCGGDRDKGKRPQMAAIAERLADIVMVTDDNPRYESPAQIMADIRAGFQHPEKIKFEHDRSKAIQEIIQCAKAGDAVLIAGKGAETYQQQGDTKTPFCDIEKAKYYLKIGEKNTC